MGYRKTPGGYLIRVDDGAFIPIDEGNKDYKEYLDWEARGNVAEPVPDEGVSDQIKSQIFELETSITNRRLREAVLGLDNGWLKDANDQISALRANLK